MDKTQEKLELWCSGQGIQFKNAEAEESYKKRAKRMADAIQLKVPDRVPIAPLVTFFPAHYADITPEEAMYDQDKEQNKREVADIKNVGGRVAGASTAAQFLAEFAGDTPWVHLDIAGTSMSEKERAYLVKGATGVPVRTLVNLVISLAQDR